MTYEEYREVLKQDGKVPQEPTKTYYGKEAFKLAQVSKLLTKFDQPLDDAEHKLIETMITDSYDYDYSKLNLADIRKLLTQICLFNAKSGF